ncbi:MAG: sulfur oxidation c-type cytochrome SoxX [Alphaproteobacteria bacterium]|nr:sulfur oxidation c-type cytochrome SoxX [Alphaproteobacteria bacterium]
MLCAVVACLMALGLSINGASADPVAAADVKIIDGEVKTSLTGQPGSAVKGAEWFKNRKLGNCLACHANPKMTDEQFHGEVGPSLEGVADRWNEAQMRAIVVNAKEIFGEQSMMPAFYRTTGYTRPLKKFAGKSILSAQQVEDIIAYLQTLK